MITYTTNEYGLRQKDMDYMLRLFDSIPAIEKVILYGSRATGDFERGSDVDIAVAGKDVTFSDIACIHETLENESPTLLWFDVRHYDQLKNEKLKGQIDSYGKLIYSR
jgi:predicted nucleotidyltransferase